MSLKEYLIIISKGGPKYVGGIFKISSCPKLQLTNQDYKKYNFINGRK